jgi:hypothetical protein
MPNNNNVIFLEIFKLKSNAAHNTNIDAQIMAPALENKGIIKITAIHPIPEPTKLRK